MGAKLEVTTSEQGQAVDLEPSELTGVDLLVPGDSSSAAVIASAAALVPGSEVVLQGVSANPSRLGFFRALARMGAGVEFTAVVDETAIEPQMDIIIRQAPLRAVQIGANEVPELIDELPLIGLLATAAAGTSEIRGAAELRLKESDRITGLVVGLRKMGAQVEELADGLVVQGPVQLRGATLDALSDHRLAMTFTVAGLVSVGTVKVSGMEFVADSFPGFLDVLRGLSL
jgi:3-phosphoshikimate 1-carboxyvinyltransferase